LLASLAPFAAGQEALRNYQSANYSASRLQSQFENAAHTIQWGKFSSLLSASLESEWTDNVRYTSSDTGSAKDDFIFRPMLNANSIYPITQYNSFKFSLGIGYEKYVENDEYDRLIIQPGSELAFNFMIGEFLFNIHDRLSFQNDPGRTGELSGTGQNSTLNNTAGLLVTWDLEDVITHFGYDYYKVISFTDGFEQQDRDTHMLLARSGVRLHPALLVGLELSGGPTFYVDELLNNNISYSAGAYAQWQPTDHLRFQARGGYILYTFDDALLPAPPDFNGYYLGFNATHVLNEKLSYTFDFGRDIQPGTASNLLDLWRASLTTQWRVMRDVSLNLGFIYEMGDQGAARDLDAIGDEYDRYGINFSAGYQLTQKLNARLGYNYYLKDSDRAALDYDQNRITLSLTYTF